MYFGPSIGLLDNYHHLMEKTKHGLESDNKTQVTSKTEAVSNTINPTQDNNNVSVAELNVKLENIIESTVEEPCTMCQSQKNVVVNRTSYVDNSINFKEISCELGILFVVILLGALFFYLRKKIIAARQAKMARRAQREEEKKKMEEQISYLTRKEAGRNVEAAEAVEPKVESKRTGFDFGSDTKTDG